MSELRALAGVCAGLILLLSGCGAKAPAVQPLITPPELVPAPSAAYAPEPAETAANTELSIERAVAALANYPLPRYDSMAEARDHYQRLDRLSQWQPLNDGPLLRVGSRHPQVRQLRHLLSLYDDLPLEMNRDSDQFDALVALALRRYQARHGLAVDGILGPESRAALNISPAERAHQLELNRVRQLQLAQLRGEGRYVQVNLPEYRVRLFDPEGSDSEMRAIIGRRDRPTPVLDSKIHTVVVNPSWNIPKSIALEDILPRWQQDAGYLNAHNYQVVAGWGAPRQLVDQELAREAEFYGGQQYLRLWQPPGENNALGQLKFDFDNAHAVYLHDTPHRGLFKRDKRAFSSGCVRVEDPARLARFLLRDDPRAEQLEPKIAEPKTAWLPLQRPVPIFLTYWTAWLDDEGRLQFRPDIYDLDRHQPQLQQIALQ